jgi:hypothetical protein
VTNQKKNQSQALVTHIYNPSYSGDRDQEDHDSKSTRANSFRDLISKKKPTQNRDDGVSQVVECLPSRVSSNSGITKKKNITFKNTMKTY